MDSASLMATASPTICTTKKDTTSITDNIISDLLVDKKGNLWIGCAKGLMRYNYETNDFTRLQFPDGRKPRIYSMVESHRGDILLGTAGYGLYSVKKATLPKQQISSS